MAAKKPVPVMKPTPAQKPMADAAASQPTDDADYVQTPPQPSGPPTRLGLGGVIVMLAIIAAIVFLVTRPGDNTTTSEDSATTTSEDSNSAGAQLCDNTCESAGDGECDDGGEGAQYDVCSLGTDCDDCGPRPAAASGDGP
jgi:hypothetical protein